MGQLNICLLGPIELKRGNTSLPGFESNKVRALLAYLAVESGRPHQRRSLAALLWPELPESSALSNLRYALSNLRKVIGDRSAQPPFLLITPQTIQFNNRSNSQVDVFLFEKYYTLAQENPLDLTSLIKATEHFRGRFLEGFSIPDSIPFEEWMIIKRERLERIAYQVFHQLAKDYELTGDYEHAIAYAQRDIELEPWREEAHQQIMRCLYYLGQRSAAIAQYETCCQLMSADLGLEPNPETQQLIEQIRQETLPLPPSPPGFIHSTASILTTRTPFVNREEPLNRLRTALGQSLGGQGQILLITGSSGQGKTALVQEFIHQAVQAQPALAVAWGNSAAYFGSGDPFLPFREILEMLTGQVEHRWEAGMISHDLARRMWRLTVPSAKVLVRDGRALIGTLLSARSLLQRVSIMLQDEPAWMSELQIRADHEPETPPTPLINLYQQYSRVIINISHQVPILIFVDDLQWADQSSLGLFFHLTRQLDGARILLLGAIRSFEEPSIHKSVSPAPFDLINELCLHHGDILINLDQSTDRNFIDACLDQEPNQIDENFRQALYRYTNSNPLYTAEMLYDLKEQGSLVKNTAGEWIVGKSLDWNYLPPRIEAAIKERLSRLPKNLKDLLKIASVEGERFTSEVVAVVQGLDEAQTLAQLRDELDRQYHLVQADSSRRINAKRSSRYRFRHILFQRYLYNQLDPIEGALLHEKVAMAMESHNSSNLDEVSVQLAIHFELAGHIRKAIHYYNLAGERAHRLSSYEAAIDHYQKALKLITDQPASAHRHQQELDLLMNLSVPLMFKCGFASPDLKVVCGRIMEILPSVPLSVEMFPIMHTLTQYYGLRAEYQTTLEVLKQAQELANMSDDPLYSALSQWGYGFVMLWLGEFEEALQRLEKMVDFYNQQKHRELHQKYGNDAGVASRIWSSWALWIMGYPEKALGRCQEALALAASLNDPINLLLAQIMSAFINLLIKNTNTVEELLSACCVLLVEHPIPIYEANLKFLQSFHLYQQGEKKPGLVGMNLGVEMYQGIGNRSMLSQYFTLLAEAHLELNQLSQAVYFIQKAENFIEETQERFYQAEVLRLKGKLHQETNKLQEAETVFLQALNLAREQKAKTFELRAATSLAKLWQYQGRFTEAYQVLDEVYGWFTEGFQAPDLLKAQQLLQALQNNQQGSSY